MPFTAITRTSFSIGALIAFLVLVSAFIFILIGGVTLTTVTVMIGALALAVLLG